MGGKSKAVTVGYWYRVLYHAGLGIGPIDAFLEFRGGEVSAWRGTLTASGTISINQPNLWGGEKDQGGIVGDVDVMFGEAAQAPNAYLLANLGEQVPAWRGLATLVFKGGKFGAMNPYPQQPSYKIRKIRKGWDGDCWYEETAEIAIGWAEAVKRRAIEDTALPATGNGGVTVAAQANDKVIIEKVAGLAYPAWSAYSADGAPGSSPDGTWLNRFAVTTSAGTSQYWPEWYLTEAAAYAGTLGRTVELTGHTSYMIWPNDPNPGDNRGGLSLQVSIVSTTIAMNPAHILYYARTHGEIGREPVANINDASFRAAADRLYAEGFGLCTSYDPKAESLAEFEQRICAVIGGSISRSLVDGQVYLDLARGDYELASLPVLTDDDILEFEEQPTVLDSAVNSISVKYFNPVAKEEVVTPPVRALALVQAFGETYETREYPEIPSAELALRVAERDLRASVTPTRAFSLTTTRKPYAWRPNTYFRLQAPKRGIADMVCILAEKQSGRLASGAMRITAAQDIYSLPSTSYVSAEPGVDTRPSADPAPVALQRAFEAPHVEVVAALSKADFAALDATDSFLLAVAADPASSRNYTLMTAPSGGSYTERAAGDWCPTALVVEGATRTATTFTLSDVSRLAEVEIGSAALWGDEIVRVDALDTGSGAITLGRGCADTVPAEHAAGSRLWFYDAGAAADATEYAAAETIDVKLLTNTGSQRLPEAGATPLVLTFAGRRVLPYPPAGVKIGGADWPGSVTGEFAVTWAHRNRESQADQLVDTTVASIAPAPNTRYGLRFLDGAAVLAERTDIGPGTATVTLAFTGTVTMELWTIDPAGASLQRHVHSFAYTPASPPPAASSITATAYTPTDDSPIIDGGDLDG